MVCDAYHEYPDHVGKCVAECSQSSGVVHANVAPTRWSIFAGRRGVHYLPVPMPPPPTEFLRFYFNGTSLTTSGPRYRVDRIRESVRVCAAKTIEKARAEGCVDALADDYKDAMEEIETSLYELSGGTTGSEITATAVMQVAVMRGISFDDLRCEWMLGGEILLQLGVIPNNEMNGWLRLRRRNQDREPPRHDATGDGDAGGD